MLDGAVRTVAGLAATPVRLVAGLARRISTGPLAVLEVVIRPNSLLIRRQQLIETLRAAADDDHVVAVLFRFDGSPAGWAAAADLRATIEHLRQSGTHTYALVENPGNAELWLASACDRVFMVPSGQVMALGIGAELSFFGDALANLGLAPDVEAAGAFKAAGEPATRSFASAANREAMRALVDSMHGRLLAGIAEARALTSERVQELLGRAPLSATEAVECGLVDQLGYADQVGDWLDERHGSDCRRVALSDWARWVRLERRMEAAGPGDAVVVLHLQGAILLEERGGAVAIAARTVVPLLNRIREARHIRGVVLHINSPGGSAYASDLIWRQVDLLVREKPVVACFEDVSASGGYYISAPASAIVARPSTLTGSIGVVGGKLVAAGAMRRVGVHTESIAATPNATMFSASAPFTPEQRERFRASLETMYDGFVSRVVSGRKRPRDLVEPHCRGRVWTGADALNVGLVDRLGDVDVAVAQVCRLATGTLRRVHIAGQARPSFLARQVQKVMREAVPIGVRALGGPVLDALGPAATALAASPGEPLALWPYEVKVR